MEVEFSASFTVLSNKHGFKVTDNTNMIVLFVPFKYNDMLAMYKLLKLCLEQ